MNALLFDIQLNAWVSIDVRELIDKALNEKYNNSRKGYYPYSYNFVLKHRGVEAQCSFCGVFLEMRQMTRDHVWPKSLGGIITTTACERCNTKKRDMKPIEFALWASENGFALRHMRYW